MDFSPRAGRGLAECAARYDSGTSGPRYLGGYDSAFASTAGRWKVDYSRNRIPGGNLFHFSECGESSSRDMDSSSQRGKPRSSRERQAHHRHRHLSGETTQHTELAQTDKRASGERKGHNGGSSTSSR